MVMLITERERSKALKGQNMAKKNETATNTETAAPVAFKRLAPVTLPILKHPENTSIFVQVDSAIVTDPKTKGGVPMLDEEGNPATISTVRVVDMETGELMNYVVGAMLKSELQRYRGGNNAYVGLCFEIAKKAAAPGKRSKGYEIFEIENPNKV